MMRMKTIALFMILFWTCPIVLAEGFVPPGPSERLKAIGSTAALPAILQKAFAPGRDFSSIPAPRGHDWLASHPEPGQTFEAFLRSKPNRPDTIRSKIYFQPLGEFPEDKSPSLDRLRQYAGAFFAMPVEVLRPMALSKMPLTTRLNPNTKNQQLLTGDVLAWLKTRLPSDAFCILAITMEDLYPDPSWNFVFGQASLSERVGVYSFARYDPLFYGQGRDKDYARTLLRRSCKVLAHETCHMFGMQHCIYFKCSLNGSNHLGESDDRPMELCPVCLRKLHWSTQFDIVQRYGKLREFCQHNDLREDAGWLQQRLEWLRSPD